MYKLIRVPRVSNVRGDILKVVSSQSSNFYGFGEMYISFLLPHESKGCKMHSKMISGLICISGSVDFNLYSCAPSQGIHSLHDKVRLISPLPDKDDSFSSLILFPGQWFSFHNYSDSPASILNFSSIPHDPNESSVLPL